MPESQIHIEDAMNEFDRFLREARAYVVLNSSAPSQGGYTSLSATGLLRTWIDLGFLLAMHSGEQSYWKPSNRTCALGVS